MNSEELCKNYDEDDLCERCHLLEERVCELEQLAENEAQWEQLRDSINALEEAWLRDCYRDNPHFPGEE